jgi:hypothetical protein
MEARTFHPNRLLGLIVGAVGLALLLGLDVVFLLLLPQPPLGFTNFLWGFLFALSLAPIGLLAYRTYAVWRSAYHLQADRLIIEWGTRLEIIPLRQIKETLAGRDIQVDLKPQGLWWPGCLVGRIETTDLGDLEFLATMPQDEQVLVVTEGGGFAISPEGVDEFRSALEERQQELGRFARLHPEQSGQIGGEALADESSEVRNQRSEEVEGGGQPSRVGSGQENIEEGDLGGRRSAVAPVPGSSSGQLFEEVSEIGESPAEVQRESFRPSFETWEIWSDRWTLGLLAVSALAVTALFAFVLLRVPSLPVIMPLHFSADGLGTPDRTGAPRGLLILPLIGLLTLFANAGLGGALYVWARQRAAAYFLLASTALVQLLVWIATLGLIARA